MCAATSFTAPHLGTPNWLSGEGEEFVRRVRFVLVASLAVRGKKAGDEKFLPVIELCAGDERGHVKKAVN